jgi:hypothetical protein
MVYTKFEIRNPKSETNSKDQIGITKTGGAAVPAASGLEHSSFDIRACFGFRASDFVLPTYWWGSAVASTHPTVYCSAKYSSNAARQSGSGGPPSAAYREVSNTLYVGRGAGAAYWAVVIGVSRTCTPARRKISAANSCQVACPALVT